MTVNTKLIRKLMRNATEFPWHLANPTVDEYEIQDVEIGPFDMLERYGECNETFVEETIATFSGCNHSSVDNAKLICFITSVLPELLDTYDKYIAEENRKFAATL